ncbi:MAG: toxin-antitoxin system HicB family antitoxin [Deltaproteobacteria bacterium]|nr:toxin-antitoxin system HicB family antitoxin [Deltaproteobacteria bacterium]
MADSVKDYLEFCRINGKTPAKPYSGCFNVRLAPNSTPVQLFRLRSPASALTVWWMNCCVNSQPDTELSA